MNDKNFLNYMIRLNSTESLGRFSRKTRFAKWVENSVFDIIIVSLIISAIWEILIKVKI